MTHLADELVVTRLKHQYFEAVDAKNWVLLKDVFADNARFEGFGFGIREGVSTLIATLSERLASVESVHEAWNPRVARVTETVIRVEWEMRDHLRWTVDDPSLSAPDIQGMNGLRGEGYYQDEVVLTAQGWRIARTRLIRTRVDALTVAGSRPLPTGSLELDPNWLLV